MTISQKALTWFDKRGICAETATRCGIYTGRVERSGDESAVVEDEGGDVIVFPFIDGGREAGAKYRAAGKRFWQRAGARKTFWNADVIDDPALHDGRYSLVITEGEMDALSVIQAGYPFVVSVPDGAPPARDKDGRLIVVPKGNADIDPQQDEKYAFIFNNWDRLKRVRRIVIATDADEPGRRLAEELVRRLDRVRCSWVEYPEGCKDFNDVLVQLGPTDVMRMITAAKPYPVSGVFKLSEIPAEVDLRPTSTGWARLDPYLQVFTPGLMVVTGFAGQGKSTWTEQLVANLARNEGWVIAMASFEMRIRPFVTDALAAVFLNRKPRKHWTAVDRQMAEDWIERQFVFVAPDPNEEQREHDVNWIIECAEAAVIRHGARVLLVDPWNEIDHARRQTETATDYTGRAIRDLKAFARKFGVLVILVVHPTKAAQSKAPDQVSLYDCSDSSHFANKADIGVVVARQGNQEHDTLTSIFVRKIRYQPQTGKQGHVEIEFDKACGLFGD